MAIRKEAKKDPFRLIEDCGIVTKANGTTMRLRYGAWYDNEPSYDLRVFNKTGRSIKGITLSGEELETLGKFIMKMIEEPAKETKETKPKTTRQRKKTA